MAYIRKTKDEWQVQGNYGDGWDVLTRHDSRREAKEMLNTYNSNETDYPHRVVKIRVKKEAV